MDGRVLPGSSPTTSSYFPSTSDVFQQQKKIAKSKLCSTTEKLFIGGISLNVRTAQLERYLSQVTQAKGVLNITMASRLKSNNYSGYGTLTSTCPEDLPRLAALKSVQFEDSWIGIKPYLTKRSDIQNLKNDKDNRKIHIKGVNSRLDELDLDTYFRRFGAVNHIQINKSQTTGSYKGFAFIEFAEESSVVRVLAVQTHTVKGVKLVCEKSKTKYSDEVSPKMASPGGVLNTKSSLRSDHSTTDKPPAVVHISKRNTAKSRTLGSIITVSKLRFIESNHQVDNLAFNLRAARRV